MMIAESLHKRGDVAGAMRGYSQILAQHRDFLPAYFNAAIVAYQLREYTRARLLWERVLAVVPMHANTHYNLGTLLQETGALDLAIDHFKCALAAKPDFPEAHTNLGTAYLAKGLPDFAIKHLTEATKHPGKTPEARFNRAFANLILGRYDEGWADYEGRWDSPIFSIEYQRTFAQLKWQGEPGRKLFLWAEQGFGDTIMMWRFIPEVVRRLHRGGGWIADLLTVEVQAPLHRLLAGNAPPGVTVIPVGTAIPDFDVQLPMMSLPHVLGVTLESIPPAPYLQSVEDVPTLDRKKRNIGIVWAGTKKHRNDARRSIPAAELAPLFNLRGINWWVVQQDRREELADVPSDGTLLLIELQDFAHTAALLRGLDRVITVDTAVAHLAGALGVPCWLMLSAWPDYRWMLDRSDSPWYPRTRLFRQQRIGEWNPVIQEIANALTAC